MGSSASSGCHHHRATALLHAFHLSGTSLAKRAQLIVKVKVWSEGWAVCAMTLFHPLWDPELLRAATHLLSYQQSSSGLCWTTFNGSQYK